MGLSRTGVRLERPGTTAEGGSLKSLGTRIALVISSVLLVLLLTAGSWLEREVTSAMRAEETREARGLAATLLASLETLMLNGQGVLAREWLDRMKGAPGILDIQVLRRDGREAFTDLATVEAVNRFLEASRFRREPMPPRGASALPGGAVQEVLQGETAVYTGDAGNRLTVLVPIRADRRCQRCHGYDVSPLRGMLQVSVSTEVAQARIAATRRNVWLGSLGLALAVGLAMWMAMRLSVLRPVAFLRDAIARVGQGDRAAKLSVGRRDELGQLACQFNRMQEELHASEARIRAVLENMADGMVTADRQGVIESANPAAERLFACAAQELVGRNIKAVIPDPYRDAEHADPPTYLPAGRARTSGIGRELSGRRSDGSIFPIELTVSEMWLGDSRHFVAIVRDITERKAQTAMLEYQALHDPLTDLPNRALLSDRLRQAILSAHRSGSSLALLLMDLNHFKDINDTLGHNSGDAILKQVARRMQAAVRESDTVARLGGDEFAVLLPGVGLDMARRVAEKLQKELERPFIAEGQRLHVGASIGIGLYPDHGEDETALMRHTDVAMYVAKWSRREYGVYDPADDQHSRRVLALMGELRTAIDAEQLVLHFQPKIDLRAGRADSVEALVYWQHPQYGLIGPSEFIPLAERTGVIRPLTIWVLTKVLRLCRQCRQSGIQLEIAVNLSAGNLQDECFPQQVAEILSAEGAAPHQLRLEITETDIMADPEHARATLLCLSQMGVKFSIDDFGTGYSSLAHLKQLPVDELKIDKSFVTDLLRDENDAVIVRSTIDLAHNFGLKVVAEGVEDRATYDALVAAGCDAAQGYYMCRPIRLVSFKRWLADSPWGPDVPQADRCDT